jgi:5S rRNA maturation endonuclease (ribonuclease M5)
VFKKGSLLFGMDVAHPHIKSKNYAIIVEGYFDVISMHEMGFKNVVAALGTSITPEQLCLAAEASESGRVVLLMDADDAGIKAAERAHKSVAKLAKARRLLVNTTSASLPRTLNVFGSANCTGEQFWSKRLLLMSASLEQAKNYLEDRRILTKVQHLAEIEDKLSGPLCCSPSDQVFTVNNSNQNGTWTILCNSTGNDSNATCGLVLHSSLTAGISSKNSSVILKDCSDVFTLYERKHAVDIMKYIIKNSVLLSNITYHLPVRM